MRTYKKGEEMKLLDVIREMNEAQARGYNLNKRLKELKNEK